MSSSAVLRGLSPLGPSRKRKERNDDGLDSRKPPSQKASRAEPEPDLDNRLLAGYLAHEFLTKGTILGRPWDPAERSEPSDKPGSYAEVAHLLKTDEAHIPGIVNPSQLTSWLLM
ncbi:hypothetical protein ACLOJK_007924 [Asimina triloba]